MSFCFCVHPVDRFIEVIRNTVARTSMGVAFLPAQYYDSACFGSYSGVDESTLVSSNILPPFNLV